MKSRKGIILAGGSGSRLFPVTKAISKQLIPIHDKPMIYYPLSVLMLAGINDILIISTQEDLPNFKKLLGSGKELGIKLAYKVQPNPDGIAQAFIIGEDFIGDKNVCLILGDNVFYGGTLPKKLKTSVMEVDSNNNAVVFGYFVNDPERYGVVEFDKNGKAISIEEKPEKPRSNYAVSGLYFYPNDVIAVAENQEPSKRGELEITDVNNWYVKNGLMKFKKLEGFWSDAGTPDSLAQATQLVKEKKNG